MSAFFIKGTVQAFVFDGRRTRIRITETLPKDKDGNERRQTVELSKYGELDIAEGDRVLVQGRIRSLPSKSGDFLNTYLEADEIFFAAADPRPEPPTVQPPASSRSSSVVEDSDIPF